MKKEQINIGDYVFHLIGSVRDDGDIIKKVICSRVIAIYEREREDLPGRISEYRYELKDTEFGRVYIGEGCLLGACAVDAVDRAIAYGEREVASLRQLLEEMEDEEPVEGKNEEIEKFRATQITTEPRGTND